MKAEVKATVKTFDIQAVKTALITSAELVKGNATLKAPRDTGRLSASIVSKLESGTRAIIGTTVEYAAIQEFGGWIKAKNKPYLVFKTRDGQWRRKEMVYIKPQPYLRPSLYENIGNIKSIFLNAIQGALK